MNLILKAKSQKPNSDYGLFFFINCNNLNPPGVMNNSSWIGVRFLKKKNEKEKKKYQGSDEKKSIYEVFQNIISLHKYNTRLSMCKK